MELKGYRETLGHLKEMFPDRVTINAEECSKALGVNIKTIYVTINRVKNPLPSVKVGENKILIPLSGLARWLCLNC